LTRPPVDQARAALLDQIEAQTAEIAQLRSRADRAEGLLLALGEVLGGPKPRTAPTVEARAIADKALGEARARHKRAAAGR